MAAKPEYHAEYNLHPVAQNYQQNGGNYTQGNPYAFNRFQDSPGSQNLGMSQSYSGLPGNSTQQIKFESFAAQSGNNLAGMTPKFNDNVANFSTAQATQYPHTDRKSINSYTVPLKGEGGRVVSSGYQGIPNQSNGQPQVPNSLNNQAQLSNNPLSNPRVQNGFPGQGAMQGFLQTSEFPNQQQRGKGYTIPEEREKSPIMKSSFLHKGSPKTTIEGLYSGLAGNNFDFSKAAALRGSELGMAGSKGEKQNTKIMLEKFRSPEIGQIEEVWDRRPNFDTMPNGEFRTSEQDDVFIPSNRTMNKLADIEAEKDSMGEAQSTENLLAIARKVRDLQYGFKVALDNERIDLGQVMLIEQYKRNSLLEEGETQKLNSLDQAPIPASGRVGRSELKSANRDPKKVPGYESEEVCFSKVVRFWSFLDQS